jgi:hypothetical protein
MANNNVILRGGWPNPNNVILRPGGIVPPPPAIPNLSGSVIYLLLFNSAGQGIADPVVSKFYNPALAVSVGCNPNALVYNLRDGTIDPRWGIFLTLPAPVMPELFFHPNLKLMTTAPMMFGDKSVVVTNRLDLAPTNYQFLVSGSGPFPLRLN